MEVSAAADRILADLLRARTGQQLTPGRRWRIGSALSAIYREHGLASSDELVALMSRPRGAPLARQVVEALLNNETYFFRDRAVFDQLANHVLPDLAQSRAADRRLSIWSAGCSTGQEALSLATLFLEQKNRWAGWTIDILGTDVSQSVIEVARQGCYSQFQVQRGLGVGEMLRWFDETAQGWRAKDSLQQKVRFEVHNLLDPLPSAIAPRRSFDLILCRNVLLYFEAPTRALAFDRLAAAMGSNGQLVLGGGETVIGQTHRFAPDCKLTGLYRRLEDIGCPKTNSYRTAAI